MVARSPRPLARRYKYAGADSIKWTQLASKVDESGIFRHAPAVTFLLNSYVTPEKKERKERAKRHQKQPDEPQLQADSVSVDQLQEVAESKAQVSRMKTQLSALTKAVGASPDGRVNLFDLLLHPTSFSQTVENLFDFAFLVKDGFATLIPESSAPYVTRSEPPVTDDHAAGIIKVQNILKIDYPTYEKLVSKYCSPGATSPKLLSSRSSREEDLAPSTNSQTAAGSSSDGAAPLSKKMRAN